MGTGEFNAKVGSISAPLLCQVYPPCLRGRSVGSFPEQRLVIEPNKEGNPAMDWHPIQLGRVIQKPVNVNSGLNVN